MPYVQNINAGNTLFNIVYTLFNIVYATDLFLKGLRDILNEIIIQTLHIYLYR